MSHLNRLNSRVVANVDGQTDGCTNTQTNRKRDPNTMHTQQAQQKGLNEKGLNE